MSPEESELLAVVGRELYLRCLGNAPLMERMSHPRPGDLVLEMTSFGAFDPDSIGRLIEVQGERGGDVERYVVEPLHRPGVQQGWQNATFIALPDRRKWLESPAEAPEGARP